MDNHLRSKYRSVEIAEYNDIDGLYVGFKVDWVYFLLTEKDFNKLLTTYEEQNLTAFIQCQPNESLKRDGSSMYTIYYVCNRYQIFRDGKYLLSIYIKR